jgi:hypothetical protein
MTVILSQLPDDIKYKILSFTGKFRVHFEKNLNKPVLVTTIDLLSPQWTQFAHNFSRCAAKRKKIELMNRNIIRSSFLFYITS